MHVIRNGDVHRVDRVAEFLQQLAPIDTPETLLLAIETSPSSGYGPLYGEGAHAPPEDNLHTFVIHVHDGRVELAGELPFLAIPQEKGFLYMGVASYERDDTEAERKRQGEKFGFDDEYGSKVYWYVASSLWRTTDRAKVDTVRKAERRRLERQRKWGDLAGEDVNYVTSRALCTTRFWAEWTGGGGAHIGLAFAMGGLWVLSGFGAHPLLNDSSSARGLMTSVGQRIGPDAELGLVAWKEQNLLMADRPAATFGFKATWTEQLSKGMAWQAEQPASRWLLVQEPALSQCIDKTKAEYAGVSNRRRWWLVPTSRPDA